MTPDEDIGDGERMVLLIMCLTDNGVTERWTATYGLAGRVLETPEIIEELSQLKYAYYNLPDDTDVKDALDILIDLQAETQELETNSTNDNEIIKNKIKLPDLPLPTFNGKFQEFELLKKTRCIQLESIRKTDFDTKNIPVSYKNTYFPSIKNSTKSKTFLAKHEKNKLCLFTECSSSHLWYKSLDSKIYPYKKEKNL
ncbi:UNVERIFIED_CONTAM: hypothetical protein NCL1_43246 [Trichonephila clavipes]